MNFCPKCGQALARQLVASDARQRLVCTGCARIHYENPRILVWCFAYYGHRLLLARRAQEPAKGMLNPPAGFVEAGESLEEAAVREVHEEVGLQLAPASLQLYRVASIPHMNEVYVGFRIELNEDPRLSCGPEVLEARLYAEAEIHPGNYAFSNMLTDAPADFFRYMREGHFPIIARTVRPRAS